MQAGIVHRPWLVLSVYTPPNHIVNHWYLTTIPDKEGHRKFGHNDLCSEMAAIFVFFSHLFHWQSYH